MQYCIRLHKNHQKDVLFILANLFIDLKYK